MSGDAQMSDAWRRWRDAVDLDDYDARWERLAAEGQSVHDEAELVDDLLDGIGGDAVLDAGCGTGRVATELARRGRRVVAADNDADMLALAKRKAEPVHWILSDLSALTLDQPVDAVVMAGNVLPYAVAAQRADIVANLGGLLRPGGLLIVGAGLMMGCGRAEMERWASAAGLELDAEYATWDRRPFDGGDYRVSLHRRPGPAPT